VRSEYAQRCPAKEATMLDDLRKTIEATVGELTPARAKSLAKSLAGPGAAKEQVAKSASELIDWSQKNRDRLREFIRREVSSQLGAVGVAAQKDLDALKKRVRALERANEKGTPAPATKRSGGAAGSGAKKSTRSPAKGRTSAKRTGGGTPAKS
jgi:polyhydroxyalkanoate synthesis regulator phasin